MRSTADRIRRAATLGSDVPRGEFPVRVHSVFHAALNLSSPDGDLLTLLSAEADDSPRGVRLASAEDFSSLGLAAGDGGVFTGGEIVLDRSAGRRPLRVDCAAARRLAAPSAPPLRGDERALARRRGATRNVAGARGDRLAHRAAAGPGAAVRRDGRASDAGRARSRPRRAGRAPRRHARRGGAASRPGAGPHARRRRFSLRFPRRRPLPARRRPGALASADVVRRGRAGAARRRRRTSAPLFCATPSRGASPGRWRRSPRRAPARRAAISTARSCASPRSATAPAWTRRRASSTARPSGAARAPAEILLNGHREFAAAQSRGRACGATIGRRRPGAFGVTGTGRK